MGLSQGEGLLMLWGDLLKNSETQKEVAFYIFVDLENAFDSVPRENISFALWQKSVPKYLVDRVMSFYKGYKTAASVDGELSSCEIKLSVKVCIHQGSALSPLLFIIVMDILTEDVRYGSLMELL